MSVTKVDLLNSDMEVNSSSDNLYALLQLGCGDIYRLEDLKQRLENGRKLYISDNNYLKKLASRYYDEIQKIIYSKKLDENSSKQITKNKLKTDLSISQNQKDVEYEKTEKVISESITTKDLMNLGIDVWRMEQRLNKIMQTIPETSQNLLKNSVQKIKRYLDKNDIEIVDYTNQKFNEGRNLDILAVEKSSNILESIIKETKEPTILYKNQVVNKGKVIILEKNSESTTHE
jgi:hypothetical protein